MEHHELQSDFAKIDFGYETDVGAIWTLLKRLIATLQFARYSSGSDPRNTRPDTEKVWLTPVWVVR